MLTARDQENLVHGHQAMAASKPLNQGSTRLAPPKTPGNRFPKTPMRIPLNDENAPTGFGKKSLLNTKGKGAENLPPTGKKAQLDKNAFITPMGPRTTRAPLGMKTTNAKARAFQTPGGLDTEHKPLQQPTSTRPLRQKIKPAESIKLEVHTDSPLRYEDREPEYCPPKWIEPPYINDDIDVESLDYSIVHKAAQSDAFYMRYGGMSAIRKERAREEAAKKRMAKEDDEFMRRFAEEEYSIEDVPETHPKKVFKEPIVASGRVPLHQRSASAFVRNPTTTSRTAGLNQAPSTISSRRAASALGGIEPRITSSRPLSTSTTSSHNRSASSGAPLAKKPLPFGLGARKPALRTNVPASSVPSTMRATSALANSRSTIGYTKGRSTSSALNSAFEPSSTGNSISAARPGSRGGMSASGGSVRPRMGLQRSATTFSAHSGESTITPAKWARQNSDDDNVRGTPKGLLEAFEGEEDNDDLGVGHLRLGGEVELPECLRLAPGEEEEEFVMTLNF